MTVITKLYHVLISQLLSSSRFTLMYEQNYCLNSQLNYMACKICEDRWASKMQVTSGFKFVAYCALH